jgi:hypothetical protein
MEKARIDTMPVTKATYLESANQSLIQSIRKVILKDDKSNVFCKIIMLIMLYSNTYGYVNHLINILIK